MPGQKLIPLSNNAPTRNNVWQAKEPGDHIVPEFWSKWRRRYYIEAAFGLAHVIFSCVCGLYYIRILQVNMQNDFWWEGFNSSGTQSFVIDLYNNLLPLNITRSIELTSAAFATQNSYKQDFTSLQLNTAYPRSIMFNELTNIESAI